MKISNKQLALLLYEITHDASSDTLHQVIDDFLGLLRKQKKINKMRAIIDEYISVYNARNKIQRIRATFSRKIDAEKLKEITRWLEKQFLGTTIEMRKRLDPSIIGGIKFQFDDIIIDASIHNKLKTIRSAFLEHA